MSEIAFQLRSISKSYKLYDSPLDQAVDLLGWKWLQGWRKKSFQTFNALKDIDLTVRRGERIGIIGRNGAGKSTLLKLITGNFQQSSGEIEINGQIQSLMDAGLGFHPELTGIENLRSSLVFNGLSLSEVKAAEEDIINFCELGDFINQPIKTYSLGMIARLGFATATAIKPDILIVDEILGAGDAYFVARSAERMKKLTSGGITLVLVSHSTSQIVQFCERALWIDGGEIKRDGDALEVVKAYERHIRELEEKRLQTKNTEKISRALETKKPSSPAPEQAAEYVENGTSLEATETGSVVNAEKSDAHERSFSRWSGSGEFLIRSVGLSAEDGVARHIYSVGESFELQIAYEGRSKGTFPITFHACFYTLDGKCISMHLSEPTSIATDVGRTHKVEFKFKENILGHNQYVVTVGLYRHIDLKDPQATKYYDIIDRSFEFKIVSEFELDPSLALIKADWKTDEGQSLRDSTSLQLIR